MSPLEKEYLNIIPTLNIIAKGLATPFPEIFHEYDRNKYVKMNYDKISKGFTPSFIQQLNCEIHPDHAWWERASHENAEARCSAFLEMSGGIPDQFALSFFDLSHKLMQNLNFYIFFLF